MALGAVKGKEQQDTDVLRVQPSLTEPAAQRWTHFLGGPIASHGLVGRAVWATPLRVLIGLALGMMSLGWLSKANCLRGDGDGVNWTANRQYISGCYADSIPLYSIEGLKDGHFPYVYSWAGDGGTRHMEYPVLTGLYQWLCAQLAAPLHWFADLIGWSVPRVGFYFGVNAVFLAIAWIGTLWFTYQLAGHRVWDIILVAASPIVGVHIFTNFDSLATVCAMGAIFLWTRKKYAGAGILIGLGAAAKLWPAYILGAFLVLVIRHRWRERTEFINTVVSAVVTWLVVNIPIMIASPAGWAEFFTRNGKRAAEDSTIYSVLSWLTGFSYSTTVPVKAQSIISFVLFGLCCVGILILGLKVRREPAVWELSLLIVAAFVLTSKVWSPQYSLWLVPLVALSLPRWRLVFAWMWVEAIYWFVRMWWFTGADNKGAPDWLFNSFVIARDALVVAILVLVIQQMRGTRPDAPRTMLQAEVPGQQEKDPGTVASRRGPASEMSSRAVTSDVVTSRAGVVGTRSNVGITA
ncbi:putative membrane protein [Corynebacterium kroppenstedtii DSM 44385]|uniref:Putative membrane protein n=1 Tax=Corynebacterium kroppenstedtii (strain DSM 44385 / JCM 11950 / CIP 105744 / CCUG 35717) TaxID=645127 RepID=C4LGG3_CORK4|nr:putative membrane protein [Corynebacterium kroppenstedtii DSM 44385]